MPMKGTMIMGETERSIGCDEWSEDDVTQLGELIDANNPPWLIAVKLRRSEDEVRAKASQLGMSLPPAVQSPHRNLG